MHLHDSQRKSKLAYLLGKLGDHQRTVYEILKKYGAIESGKLFSEYCRTANEHVVDRSYRNNMKRMVEMGLVKEHGSGRWKRYEIIA